jgi:hypothetical protein
MSSEEVSTNQQQWEWKQEQQIWETIEEVEKMLLLPGFS